MQRKLTQKAAIQDRNPERLWHTICMCALSETSLVLHERHSTRSSTRPTVQCTESIAMLLQEEVGQDGHQSSTQQRLSSVLTHVQ